jgi:enoyl-CoA hydratase
MALIFEKRNHLAYLTLNRPEAHNAFDPETVLELAEAWKTYRDDEALRCAIITGAGDQSFCAGADLSRLIPLLTGAREPQAPAEQQILCDPALLQHAILRDFELYKPIVAAVNGDAIAGGMEMLYATDIRVAAEQARFGLQEVKWSVFPAGGSTVRLPQQMPYARVMELLLTGELMNAAEALSLGFVNRVVPQRGVMEEAERLADIIARNGPLAVSAIKRSVLTNAGRPLPEALAKELELAVPVFLSEDAQEGPRAFKEKREPVFKGR